MRNRSLAIALIMTISSALPAFAVSATPHLDVHPLFSNKTKLIGMDIRNDTPESIQVKVGDEVKSIDSKQTVHIKAAEGTPIVAVTSIGSQIKAGDSLGTVNHEHANTTISFR